MPGQLTDRVALVTGAARGQGRDQAVRLAAEGADIIAVDLCADIASNRYPLATESDLAETARQVTSLRRRIVTAKADVRERGQLAEALARGVGELGRLDILVAQAGISPLGLDVAPQAFLDAVSVNLAGVINTVDVALQYLTAGASIVCTGSVGGLMPRGTDSPQTGPGGAGYSHSKRGVARFVHDLALQLAPHSIRVNAVHPTNVNTDMLQSEPMYDLFRPDLEHPTREEAEQGFRTMQPMPIPYIEPADVSEAVLYLVSDASRFVTGQQLKVDAGALLRSTNSGAPH